MSASQNNMSSNQICYNPKLAFYFNEASSKEGYHGRCKYGKGIICSNERTLKLDGKAHRLCKNHREVHNKYQRKSDHKRRAFKRSTTMSPNARYQHRVVRPSIKRSSPFSPSMENIMPTPLSEIKWSSSTSSFEAGDHWQWSAEEIYFLQTIMAKKPFDVSHQAMFDMLPEKSDIDF